MGTLAERLKEFNKGFLKESLAIKYKRIAENEFRFFRGTCHLFYEDLSKRTDLPPSPIVWICGDLHLENFGSFKGNNRLVYFDLNDFGEAILAPALWEVARITTSIFVAFDSLEIAPAKAEKIASLFLETYSATLKKGKALYIEPQVAKGIIQDFLTTVAIRKQKELLRDRTSGKGNKLRLLIDNDRHYALDKKLKKELHDHIMQWISKQKNIDDFRCLDIAFRIAGTGSIGINRYCFLFRHLTKAKSYLLLDMKEVTASSLLPYITIQQPRWSNEAERICIIEEFMQNTSPALLGSTHFRNADYMIRELQPSSDKIDFQLIKKSNKDLSRVISAMAILTASAQLRSAGRKGAAIPDDLISFGSSTDPIAIGGWQKEILSSSKKYSNEVKRYYTEYLEGYKKGIY
ncbi:MAG: DUF2252 family protein [Ferruginibacter sp.]|nr:DUF2252 family protein [Chitinophagaceae bacterium]